MFNQAKMEAKQKEIENRKPKDTTEILHYGGKNDKLQLIVKYVNGKPVKEEKQNDNDK